LETKWRKRESIEVNAMQNAINVKLDAALNQQSISLVNTFVLIAKVDRFNKSMGGQTTHSLL